MYEHQTDLSSLWNVTNIPIFAEVLCVKATSASSPVDPQDLARVGTGSRVFHCHSIILSYHLIISLSCHHIFISSMRIPHINISRLGRGWNRWAESFFIIHIITLSCVIILPYHHIVMLSNYHVIKSSCRRISRGTARLGRGWNQSANSLQFFIGLVWFWVDGGLFYFCKISVSEGLKKNEVALAWVCYLKTLLGGGASGHKMSPREAAGIPILQ